MKRSVVAAFATALLAGGACTLVVPAAPAAAQEASAEEAIPADISVLANETIALLMNTLPRRVDEPLRVAVEGLQTDDLETRLGQLFAMTVTTRLVNRSDDRLAIVAMPHYESMMMASLPAQSIREGIERVDLVINGKVYLAGETLTAIIHIIRLPGMTIEAGFEKALPATPRTRELLGSGGSAGGGDGWEPDSAERPRPLSANETLSGHSLQPEGDEDWFVFEAGETAYVGIYTLGETDTYIEVYDASDLYTPIIENDDHFDANARVDFAAAPEQRFLIKVRGYSESTVGDYELACTLESFGEDTSEPDNMMEQARMIPSDGTAVDRMIMPAGDTDWFAIDVPEAMGAGTLLIIETLSDMDTVMELVDETGYTVASDDDGGEGNNARIEFSLPHAGRFFAVVRPFSEGSTGFYQIQARLVQLTPDGYEPDDTLDQATLIEFNGASQEHSFTPDSEEDWIRFVLPGSGNVTIETRGELDTVMTLFDAGGNEIGGDDDGGTDMNALIERYLPAGTYFVRITQYQGPATGSSPYTVRVTGR